MEHNEKQYIAGFNNGYILANHEPLTLSSVVKGLQSDNSHIKGLPQGQLDIEKVQSRYRLNELSRLRDKSIDKKNRDME